MTALIARDSERSDPRPGSNRQKDGSERDGHLQNLGRQSERRSFLVLASLLLCGHVFAQTGLTPADRAFAREILEELVEMPTTEVEGTMRAAQAMANRLIA